MDIKPRQVYSLLSIRNLYTVYHVSYSGGFSFSGERHNFWEFSYIINGSIGCTAGDNVYICHAGDGVLHAPNQYHTMWVNEDSACEIFTISFDGTGMEHRLEPGKYLLSDEEKRSVHGIIAEAERLIERGSAVDFDELPSPSSADQIEYQIIKSHLELICLSLLRKGRQLHGKPLSDAASLCYTKITAYLRDNIEKKLELDDICRAVYESPAKVKTVFRRFTNGGVMNYFNQMRCEHIMRLLSEGNSVKKIADIMHFSSPYYLSYFFKRETGMTPQEYKKKLRG